MSKPAANLTEHIISTSELRTTSGIFEAHRGITQGNHTVPHAALQHTFGNGQETMAMFSKNSVGS